MSRTVTVVVATHNGRKFLRACLEALLATELPAGWELQPIVVDNGSSDGSGEFMRLEYPHVQLLEFDKGLGFAGANNAARKVARGEVVVFLNNDTRVTPGWLQRPLEILAADPRVAVVGSRLLFMHRFRQCTVLGPPGTRLAVAGQVFATELDNKVRFGPECSPPGETRLGGMRWVPTGGSLYVPDPIPGLDPVPRRPPVLSFLQYEGTLDGVDVSCGGVPLRLSRTYPQARAVPEVLPRVELIQAAGGTLTPGGDGGDFAAGEVAEGRHGEETVVPTICGAAYIARRAALDAVGWFPTDYVVYYEDTHLSLALRAKGQLLVYCPSSVVYHYHTGTNREHSPFFIENVARSRLTFAAHFIPPKTLARRLVDQSIWSAREVMAAGNVSLPTAWTRAPGLRGMVKSLPAVARATTRRIVRGEFGEGRSILRRLSTERQPYRLSVARGHS